VKDDEIQRKLSVSNPTALKKMMASKAQDSAKALERIYILERDSKMVYTYDMLTKTISKRSVNIPNKFEHNF
jgi:hypothetical protein